MIFSSFFFNRASLKFRRCYVSFAAISNLLSRHDRTLRIINEILKTRRNIKFSKSKLGHYYTLDK